MHTHTLLVHHLELTISLGEQATTIEMARKRNQHQTKNTTKKTNTPLLQDIVPLKKQPPTPPSIPKHIVVALPC